MTPARRLLRHAEAAEAEARVARELADALRLLADAVEWAQAKARISIEEAAGDGCAVILHRLDPASPPPGAGAGPPGVAGLPPADARTEVRADAPACDGPWLDVPGGAGPAAQGVVE